MPVGTHRGCDDGPGFGGWMQIDFGDARRQAGKYLEYFRFVHRTAVGKAENLVVVQNPRGVQPGFHESNPWHEEHAAGARRPCSIAAGEPGRFGRYPYRRRSVVSSDSQHHLEYGWMQMEMLVHVDVIQRKPGSRECRKLGANLSLELLAHRRQRKIAD